MKELDMKRLFLCISLLLLVGMTSNSRLYAQEPTLEESLNYISFSEMSYRNRFFPGGQKSMASTDFDSRLPAKMYDDLTCKMHGWATESKDLMPSVYLKIALPDKSILGALTFGGATAYRTDLLFIRDRKGVIHSSLECCVMFLGFAIKQYELREMEELVVYQMIFEPDKVMPYEDYCVEPVPVTGHIHKTTYFIAPTKQFVKMKEEDTDTKSFSSFLLQEHDLWDEKAFGMTYKK